MLKQKSALAPPPGLPSSSASTLRRHGNPVLRAVPDILATKSFDDTCEPSSNPHDTYARNRARPSHSFVGELTLCC